MTIDNIGKFKIYATKSQTSISPLIWADGSIHWLEGRGQAFYDGIGMPEKFDSNKPKTLGIHLVRSLLQQLRGSMAINCQQGTEFRICFRV